MGACVDLFVQGQQAVQLDDRCLVVVHPQVDEAIVASGVASVFSHHEQRGLLSAARVATGVLPRRQRVGEPVAQSALGLLL